MATKGIPVGQIWPDMVTIMSHQSLSLPQVGFIKTPKL